MISSNKKLLLAYSFLAFFLLLTIGGSGFIVAKRYQIKSSVRSMIEHLPQSELLPIQVNYTQGAEELNEFEVDGEMYDVANYKIVGARITYYCYYDKAETNLNFLAAHWSELQNISRQRQQLARLCKLTKVKYVNSYLFLNLDIRVIPLFFPEVNTDHDLVENDISTPPPRLLIV